MQHLRKNVKDVDKDSHETAKPERRGWTRRSGKALSRVVIQCVIHVRTEAATMPSGMEEQIDLPVFARAHGPVRSVILRSFG